MVTNFLRVPQFSFNPDGRGIGQPFRLPICDRAEYPGRCPGLSIDRALGAGSPVVIFAASPGIYLRRRREPEKTLKVGVAGKPLSSTTYDHAYRHINDLCLGRRFNLIIAPFRGFQNLETDRQIDGFFKTVRERLAPRATCILNVFNPDRDRLAMRREWMTREAYPCWETTVRGGCAQNCYAMLLSRRI